MPLADRPQLEARAILERLVARGVDFVVVGGVAAVLHGSPRNTFDLDVCFAADGANLGALGDVLVELGARLRGVEHEVPFTPDGDALRRVQLLTLRTRLGDLDVMTEPEGAPRYPTLRAHADRVDLGGFTVLVASIEDLVAMKQAAGRPKDLADVAELQAIRRLRRRLEREERRGDGQRGRATTPARGRRARPARRRARPR